jgi:hypothetical protein
MVHAVQSPRLSHGTWFSDGRGVVCPSAAIGERRGCTEMRACEKQDILDYTYAGRNQAS